ncbi:MAG: DUF2092 domain-containing protein [Planctomycetota bacterium]|nr:DUF2092 domain-containing protein [Planctomycetota bacterium]
MMVQELLKQPGVLVALCVLTCCPIGSTYAQDDQATEILRGMSAEIASLDKFIITGDGYTDDRLDEGQIVEHSMDVTMRMNRSSNAMRITNRDAESTKEIYFGEGVFTVYSQTDNFFAQTAIPDGIDAATNFAVNEIGIDAPVLDFVSSDVAGHLLEDAETVDYLGLSLFRGLTYHHIAVRAPEVDLQFWVAAEGPPLPGKMAISSKWEGGSPRSVFFFSWDTSPDFGRSSFSFEPPAGSVRIAFDRDLDQ